MRALFRKHRVSLALLVGGALAVMIALGVHRRTLSHASAATATGAVIPVSAELVVDGSDNVAASTATARQRAGSDDPATLLQRPLPRGITDIDGEGGRGVHRAVLKNGVWFPVYSPGDAETLPDGTPGPAPLAEVPLSITSGTPPPGRVSRPFAFPFDAIGGVPPYRWSIRLSDPAARFAMDQATGLFAGSSAAPLNALLEVFVSDDLGATDSARYPLAIVDDSPLAIATALLPEAAPDAAYATRLEATGGLPPYTWAITGAEDAGLLLTSNTGELTGQPMEPGVFPLGVSVTDADGMTVVKSLTLTVAGPGLQITTGELPDATADAAYSATLAGEGGVAPYVWASASALPAGLLLDAAAGVLSGKPTKGGEWTVELQLTDAQGATVSRSLPLTIVSGLGITTPAPLFPGSPDMPYELTFTASGGLPPYRWAVVGGSLPPAWALSVDGQLTGVAGPAEDSFAFTVEVRDAQNSTFSKPYTLPVRQTLLAIASQQKVGLAWQPEQIDRALRVAGAALAGVAVVRAAGRFPQNPGEGALVYRGTGNNFVDRNLPTGSTAFYTLFVQTTAGETYAFATAGAKILPITTQRAQPGVTGDPFADRCTLFAPLTGGGFGAGFVPGNITGPPDGKGTFAPSSSPAELASLHARAGAGGSVIVEFTDNIVELRPGMDFTVFENVFFIGGKATARFMEPAIVWVALFEGQWFRFPIDVVPPADGAPLNLRDPFYYNRGFAGRSATTGSDPTSPATSGGDSFDADELGIVGLTWIRFIRLQSAGDQALTDDFGGDPVRHNGESGALSGAGSSGFDFDAVSAVNF